MNNANNALWRAEIAQDASMGGLLVCTTAAAGAAVGAVVVVEPDLAFGAGGRPRLDLGKLSQ